MKRPLIAAALLLLFLFTTSAETLPGFFDKEEDEVLIEKIVSNMSNSELLGQTLMFSFFGYKPSSSILSWISEKNIGGIKLFGWNVKDLPTLGETIGELQKKASKTRFRIPLFIASDQEGGWVRHIKGKTSITPGNLSIGATGIPYDAYMTGLYIGRELRTLGINMNFAPTVDIYSNPDNVVIGPRSFSKDPVATAALSVAFYKGLDKSGVISTAKHFPGHGDFAEDSHGTLPVSNISFKTMWNRELLPYRYLIKRDIPAIMTGHLSFPEITGDGNPASLSPYFLKTVLREKMGFKGLIITDDMRMTGAILTTKDTPQACMEAIIAGTDVIMISHGEEMYQKVWHRLYYKIGEDPDFRRAVISAVKHILRIKLKYLKQQGSVPLYPNIDDVEKNIPSKKASDFFFSQACRSVSIIRQGEIPIKKENTGKVLIAAPYKLFLSTGKEYFPEADTFYFPFSPQEGGMGKYKEQLADISRFYDTIIFSLTNENSSIVLSGLEKSSAKIFVISSLTPVYLRNLHWVKSAIAVYGTGIESFIAGFSALLGSFTPEGHVPIPIDTSWNIDE